MHLLFLFALALVIFARLWSLFGKHADTKRPRTIYLDERDVEVKKHSIRPSDLYPGFDEHDFLEGAETAYHRVLEAYHKGDKKALKTLVAPSLLQTIFEKTPEHTPSRVTLTAAGVTQKEMKGITALVSVHFAADLIYEDRTVHTEDTWVFKRKISDSNPNWVLERVEAKTE